MRVNLTDGYYITNDAYNFTLMKDYEVKKGKFAGNETSKVIGYWSNTIYGLKGLIKRYLEVSSLEHQNERETEFRNFCEDLESDISFNTQLMIDRIGEYIMVMQEADNEIKRLRKELGCSKTE